MHTTVRIFITLLMICAVPMSATAIETVTTTWGGDAGIAYETGFMHMLMQRPDGGVCLFNMELIENDSPGGGTSEKGESTDLIYGPVRARKILNLEKSGCPRRLARRLPPIPFG